jgi:hypothetical protein
MLRLVVASYLTLNIESVQVLVFFMKISMGLGPNNAKFMEILSRGVKTRSMLTFYFLNVTQFSVLTECGQIRHMVVGQYYYYFIIIWFVRLMALRPLLVYCASLG